MADTYIDQFETLAYGPFAVDQIKTLVIGLDPNFDKLVKHLASQLTLVTEAMRAALHKAGAIEVTTFKQAESRGDPLAQGHAVFRRLIKYVESRPDGDAIASKLLGGDNLTTVLRRRPQKLVAAMTHALGEVTKHKKALPEHDAWIAEVGAARDAIDALDKSVRKSRVERRAMTPEVQAARAEWLKVYGAAKLVVEAALRLHDKLKLLPEVFDDLAEIHRAPGVKDEAPAEAPAPA